MFFRPSVKVTQLAGRPHSAYLTKTDQIIDGEVRLYGNLTINGRLQVRDLNVAENKLHSTQICGLDLMAMLADCVRRNDDDDRPAVITGAKTFSGNVTIEKLTLGNRGFVFGLENNWSDIVGHLERVQNEIQLYGPFDILNRVRIDDLQVNGGTINGISSVDFGKVWLLRERDQVKKIHI